jgi:hypothetical protein
MFQYVHAGDRIVPDAEYHRLYAIKQPPRGYVVWMAHRTIYADNTGRELLVASREEIISQIQITTPSLDVMQWIWPIQGDVTWPPSVAVEAIGGFLALHNSFNPPPQAPA